MKKVLFLAAALMVLICTNAGAIVWTGSASTNWFSSGNWDLNRIPTGLDQTWVGGIPLSVFPVINGAAVSGDLYVGVNGYPGTLTLNSGSLNLGTNRFFLAGGGTGLSRMTVNGGTLDVAIGNKSNNTFFVGNNSGGPETGEFIINNGTVTNQRNFCLGQKDNNLGILRMYGGTLTACIDGPGGLAVGASFVGGGTGRGELYLYGGTIYTNKFVMATKAGASGYMDIRNNGRLIIDGDATSSIQQYVNLGWIKAWGGRKDVLIDFDTLNAGKTTVYTDPTPPDTDKAWNPAPEKDAKWVDINPTLTWLEGDSAQAHRVFIGDNYDAVMNAVPDLSTNGQYDLADVTVMAEAWMSNPGAMNPTPDFSGDDFVNFLDFSAMAGLWLEDAAPFMTTKPLAQKIYQPGTLEYGKTYYWRIDEENAGSITQGDIWAFTTNPRDPRLAHEPFPRDFGENFTAASGLSLTWQPGQGALTHHVYFGTNETQVRNADTSTAGIYKGSQGLGDEDYVLGPLSWGQTYYWRIDEFDGSQVHKGPVWQFTVTEYGLDYGIKPPTHLYAIPFTGMSYPDLIAVTSVQGIVAQTRPEIYMYKESVNTVWLYDLADTYNIPVTYVPDIIGAQSYLEWTLAQFSSHLTGYILYDMYTNDDSLNIASSLAGIYKAVIIDATIESAAQAAGLTKVLDVRTQNNSWLYTNYFGQMNCAGLIIRDPDPASWYCTRLHDLSSSIRLMMWWDSNISATASVMDSVIPNSPCFGWSDGYYDNEGDFVEFHAEHGLYTKPSNGVLNFSTLMGMANFEPRIEFKQKTNRTFTPESNVHYVTFIHTDMDNVSMLLSENGWANGPTRYGNPHRGEFAMGWGMSATMIRMAPSAMRWWFDNMTENDNFVLPFSGMGYAHPSDLPFSAVDDFVAESGRYMKKGDMKSILLNDNGNYAGGSTIANMFADIPFATGFFVTGGPYHEFGYDIRWYGGKPFISVKYSLWEGYESPSSLASKLNSKTTDVNREDCYTPVVVHAWSYGLDDVWNCVQQLDSNVRVITPEEMIERVKMNNVNR